MKRRSVLLFWLMMAVWAAMSAQCVGSSKSVEPSKKIFANPEVMPVYPGGQKALMAFVSDRVIPKLMKADSTLMGTMVVNFIIDKKGRCKDFKVYRSKGSRFDKIIIREMKHMKRWKPCMQLGRPVSMRYNVPIRMKVKQTQRVKSMENPFPVCP